MDKYQNSDIIFYTSPKGNVHIEVMHADETFWLQQKRIAELFGVDRTVITKHLQNIFQTGELEEGSVCANFAHTAEDGKAYQTNFYNLDAIIAVGYRVSSIQATQFRIWATKVLREFIIKGFVLDDDRLKQGSRFRKDYFDELVERIREIRASERRFYQKITDIYEQCSIDYNENSVITQTFFKTVHNKLHWAITGKTAPQIVADRSSASKTNMGLKNWKNAPFGKILRTDVSIAKNYLEENEVKSLERIVSMYLDYAENQAARHIPMKMVDWATKLDAFLEFNEYKILKDAGKISHDIARKLAEEEYEKFRVIQDKNFESDFDKEIKKLNGAKK